MELIGPKQQFFPEGSLTVIDYSEKPEALPSLGLDTRIYAGVVEGDGSQEAVFLLKPGQEALGEVRDLWNMWKANGCKSVTFYQAP